MNAKLQKENMALKLASQKTVTDLLHPNMYVELCQQCKTCVLIVNSHRSECVSPTGRMNSGDITPPRSLEQLSAESPSGSSASASGSPPPYSIMVERNIYLYNYAVLTFYL